MSLHPEDTADNDSEAARIADYLTTHFDGHRQRLFPAARLIARSET